MSHDICISVVKQQTLLTSAISLSSVSHLVLLLTKRALTLRALPILNTAENNKIMNGVLIPGRVQRLCQGVLYFRDVIQFHALWLIVNHVLWAISTHILPRHSLLSECCMIYTHKYNFVYACKKSRAFSVPVFVKLTNAQQHCVWMSDTGFHPSDNKCGNYG